VSLDWLDHFSCEQFDFCLPWKIAGCQLSGLQPKPLPVNAVSEEHQPDLLVAQTCLRELTELSKDQVPVPDGLVPTALKLFLTGLGCGLLHVRLIITQAVTLNEDAVTHSKAHPYPLCLLQCTVFFKIHTEHRTASATLIQVTLQKQQDDVNASLKGDGQTRVNSIVARAAANHHGLYLCFGCAARSLTDMCPPRVFTPVSTPTQMKTGDSGDNLTFSKHDQVVGQCDVSSDLTESVKHGPSLPLKQPRHVPQEKYTVPDWNSPPKRIPFLLDSPQSAASGTSPPTCWPVPTSSWSKQLVLEELRTIAGTISSTPRLTKTSSRVTSGTHNQW